MIIHTSIAETLSIPEVSLLVNGKALSAVIDSLLRHRFSTTLLYNRLLELANFSRYIFIPPATSIKYTFVLKISGRPQHLCFNHSNSPFISRFKTVRATRNGGFRTPSIYSSFPLLGFISFQLTIKNFYKSLLVKKLETLVQPKIKKVCLYHKVGVD